MCFRQGVTNVVWLACARLHTEVPSRRILGILGPRSRARPSYRRAVEDVASLENLTRGRVVARRHDQRRYTGIIDGVDIRIGGSVLAGTRRIGMETLEKRLRLATRPRLIKGPTVVARSPRAAETPARRGPVAAHISTPPSTEMLEGVETGPGHFGTSPGTAAAGLDMRR